MAGVLQSASRSCLTRPVRPFFIIICKKEAGARRHPRFLQTCFSAVSAGCAANPALRLVTPRHPCQAHQSGAKQPGGGRDGDRLQVEAGVEAGKRATRRHGNAGDTVTVAVAAARRKESVRSRRHNDNDEIRALLPSKRGRRASLVPRNCTACASSWKLRPTKRWLRADL